MRLEVGETDQPMEPSKFGLVCIPAPDDICIDRDTRQLMDQFKRNAIDWIHTSRVEKRSKFDYIHKDQIKHVFFITNPAQLAKFNERFEVISQETNGQPNAKFLWHGCPVGAGFQISMLNVRRPTLC